jgi:hypothetical protein
MTEDIYVAVWKKAGLLGEIQYGAWREASAVYTPNFHTQGLWSTQTNLGSSTNCKTIDLSGSVVSQDVPSNAYCVDANTAYFGWDAGTYRCEAVP